MTDDPASDGPPRTSARAQWEKQAREDMERIAKSGEDLSEEPDEWAPDGTARPPTPCTWNQTRWPHIPHTWTPEPGMDPAPCPGYTTE